MEATAAPCARPAAQPTPPLLPSHRPPHSYAVLIDGVEKKAGSLFEDFEPSINPPETIPDPEDKKPEDWVDEAKWRAVPWCALLGLVVPDWRGELRHRAALPPGGTASAPSSLRTAARLPAADCAAASRPQDCRPCRHQA